MKHTLNTKTEDVNVLYELYINLKKIWNVSFLNWVKNFFLIYLTMEFILAKAFLNCSNSSFFAQFKYFFKVNFTLKTYHSSASWFVFKPYKWKSWDIFCDIFCVLSHILPFMANWMHSWDLLRYHFHFLKLCSKPYTPGSNFLL